jgi:hypothetical protein
MAYQGISTGSVPNDGTGDDLLTGAVKINSNFQELYSSIETINTSGVSIFNGLVSGITSVTDLRLSSASDKVTIFDGNDITLSYDSGGGNVAICSNPTGPIKLNVVNIPTDSSFDNRILSFSVIVNQGTTAYACTSVTLNGVAFGANAAVGVQTHIAYLFGIVATGNTSGYDFFNFTAINTVGSAATTTNYKILSNVSGGYQRY